MGIIHRQRFTDGSILRRSVNTENLLLLGTKSLNTGLVGHRWYCVCETVNESCIPALPRHYGPVQQVLFLTLFIKNGSGKHSVFCHRVWKTLLFLSSPPLFFHEYHVTYFYHVLMQWLRICKIEEKFVCPSRYLSLLLNLQFVFN